MSLQRNMLPPGCSFDRTNSGSVYVVGRGHRRVTPLCNGEDQAAEMAWEQYRAFHDVDEQEERAG